MIDLALEEFILWIISVPMVVVGCMVFISGWRRRAVLKAARRHIVTCHVCGFIYQDRGRDRAPACPECGRANERGPTKRLG